MRTDSELLPLAAAGRCDDGVVQRRRAGGLAQSIGRGERLQRPGQVEQVHVLVGEKDDAARCASVRAWWRWGCGAVPHYRLSSLPRIFGFQHHEAGGRCAVARADVGQGLVQHLDRRGGAEGGQDRVHRLALSGNRVRHQQQAVAGPDRRAALRQRMDAAAQGGAVGVGAQGERQFIDAVGDRDADIVARTQKIRDSRGQAVAGGEAEGIAIVRAAPVGHAKPRGQGLRVRAAADCFDQRQRGRYRRADAGAGDELAVGDIAHVLQPDRLGKARAARRVGTPVPGGAAARPAWNAKNANPHGLAFLGQRGELTWPLALPALPLP